MLPLALLASTALAGGLPAQGAPFVVRELGTADPYYSVRDTLVGTACTASADWRPVGEPWGSGSATCGDRQYKFAQARVELGAGAKIAVPRPEVSSEPIRNPPGDRGAVPAGVAVRIADIGGEDSYFPRHDDLVGLSCTTGDNLAQSGLGGWSGPMECSDGGYYFFYDVYFDAEAAGTAVGGGRQFRVVELAPADAYVAQQDHIVGMLCTAVDVLEPTEPGFVSGQARCDDGVDYYFYAVRIEPVGEAAGEPPVVDDGRFRGGYLAKGAHVRILAVSADDGYAPFGEALVGMECKIVGKSGLTLTGDAAGDGWMGGNLKCAGTKLAFYSVAVTPLL